METVKNIVTVLYIIVCVVLIFITIIQNKDSRNSMEDVAENPRANKYYDKNKGRTKTGKIQKQTIIAGVVFAVFTVILGIVYVL